jgi:hypothetical protein
MADGKPQPGRVVAAHAAPKHAGQKLRRNAATVIAYGKLNKILRAFTHFSRPPCEYSANFYGAKVCRIFLPLRLEISRFRT